MKDVTETENTKDEKPKHDFSPKAADWGFLNPMFLGRISLCDKKGELIKDTPVVSGVTIDADMAVESQYNSPFENSNPESRLPTLMGMLQGGDWVNTVDKVLGNLGLGSGEGGGLTQETKDKLNQLEGRSNFTKVNSTQIYVSSSPVRLNVTMFFEAWADARHEVEHQIATLQQWSLPIKLSDDSILGNMAEDISLQSLFPSEVPPFVAFTYAKKRYVPLLIESVSAPLVAPLDKNGNRIILEVTLTLVSRTAWDRANITQLYK